MRILVAVVLVVLAAPALNAKPGPAPAPDPALAALASLKGQAFDVAFMRALIPVDEEAVEIALVTTLNADHSDLLQWNQKMIDRKSGQVKKMLAWLQEAGAGPAGRNAGVMTLPVKQMRGLQGAALERAFLPLMASHLDRSTALAALAATKANRAELRAFAQGIVGVEKQEATMLRDWNRKWYGK